MERTLEYYLSLDYPVEIRRIEESLGGGYVASISSLGSQAFVGDGDTPQEAYENLQAAKAEIFAEYVEQGLAIPEPVVQAEYEDYSGKLMLRMPRELHARLAAAAKQNDTSLNQFILYALSSFEGKCALTQEVREVLAKVQRTSCRTAAPGFVQVATVVGEAPVSGTFGQPQTYN